VARHKKDLGERGEKLAVDYLEKKDYKILERNWRTGRMEIDIIAKIDNIIVVFEVKTRKSDTLFEPASTVTDIQIRRLADAYSYYADEKDYTGECRFDIIGVTLADNAKPIIRHYEDAFFPG